MWSNGRAVEWAVTQVKRRKGWRMSYDVGKTFRSLYLRHSSFSSPSYAFPTSQLILQPFRCFTYIIDTSPTSQLILQPYRRFIYATAHSITSPPLHLRHRSLWAVTWVKSWGGASFSNPYIASPTSQLILQPFCRFTYVTANCTALPLLYLRHLESRPCPYVDV